MAMKLASRWRIMSTSVKHHAPNSPVNMQEIARTMEGLAVRGCYESRVPSSLVAMRQLGCSARVTDTSIISPPHAGWPLSSIAFYPAATPSYLAGGGASGLGLLRYVGVAVAMPRAGAFGHSPSRGVFVVLLPAQKKISVTVLLRDGIAARELYTVVAEEAWEQAVAEMKEGGHAVHPDIGRCSVSVRPRCLPVCLLMWLSMVAPAFA
jgi:hypothetical protein